MRWSVIQAGELIEIKHATLLRVNSVEALELIVELVGKHVSDTPRPGAEVCREWGSRRP